MGSILAIDEGTSSVRALLFSETGALQDVSQRELNLFYPNDGWVEQNPQEIIDKTLLVVRDLLSRVEDKSSIACAGLTNQRETVIVWNRHTGDPIYNAIVWQDRRTADFCKQLKGEGVEDNIRKSTGLLLDPYFSASKIKWILDHVEGARESALNGDLLCGTIDCYVVWKLTSGRSHVTDVTNASRTMLCDINGFNWSNELLQIFDIPKIIMPSIEDNVFNFGTIDSDLIGFNLPILGCAGDQHAALIGQGCTRQGMSKATYGTGCFMLMNSGSDMVLSEHDLLTTVGYKISDHVSYAFEGSIFNAGTAIQFLRDNFGFVTDVKQSEELALSVDSSEGVYFVPAFTGLGAPHWNPDARGLICGLTRDSSQAHIVRAALEAQAYQTRDLIDAIGSEVNSGISALRADGGLVANDFMCQFLADILDLAIEIPKVSEATAWGAACLAGIGAGVFEDLDHTSSLWSSERQYTPDMDEVERETFYSGWKKAVARSF